MKTEAEASGVEANTVEPEYRGYDNVQAEAEKPDFNAAVNLAEGRGGETRRALKSRHIQFLYVVLPLDRQFLRLTTAVRLVAPLAPASLLALELFYPSLDLRLCSWGTLLLCWLFMWS